MAPWLLLTLTLAQSPDPSAAAEAQRAQEEAQRRQGEAQSMDGTLDGGTTSTGAPDSTLPGTGGSGVQLPGAADAGTFDAGAPATVPSPFPDTGGAGDAGAGGALDPRFAPGTGSTAPGSTGTSLPAPPANGGTGTPAPPLDTGRERRDDTRAAAGDAAAGTVDDGTGEEAPGAVDEAGTVSMGAMEIEGPPSAATPEEAAAALRAQVQALQAREQELTAQQQALAERTEALQAQLDEARERAQALEEARQERAADLEDVSQLLVDVDTALSVGESDVEGQVADALGLLAQVADNAEASGQGDAVLVSERALSALSGVNEAIQRRDYYFARLALQAAAESVRAARRDALERSDGALVTEPGSVAPPAQPAVEVPLMQYGY